MSLVYFTPLLAITLTFLILRRRQRLAIKPGEGAAVLAFAVLATVQGAFQSQIHVDDWGFTAGYIAIVVLLGMREGAFSAAFGATLCVSALLLVASTHPLEHESAFTGTVPAEWVTLWITLVAVGVLAASLMRLHPYAAPFASFAFVLFPLTHDPGVLYGATMWAAMTLGVALAAVAQATPLRGRIVRSDAEGATA